MTSTSVVSSISRFGRTEPFDLQVARGQVAMHSVVHKFGYSSVIDGTEYPIWNIAANRVYLTTAAAMKVSSSSANDAIDGTGARTVLVSGLNSSYEPISETVELDGQTEVATTATFLRVTGIQVLTAGSGGKNAGVIYVGTGTVTTGVPAVVHELAPIGYNASSSGVYTVPAGYTAYFRRGGISTEASNNGYVLSHLVTSNQGSPFTVAATTVLVDGIVDYSFDYPIALPEKTDIEARATATVGAHICTAFFEMLLVKNNGQA